jgi:hypothetical protein
MQIGKNVTQLDHLEGRPSNMLVRNGISQPDAKSYKALFTAAIKPTGELVTRISAQTQADKMALSALLRVALSHLEEEFRMTVRPATVQDQVSNILKAA